MDTAGIPHPPHRLPLVGDVIGVHRDTPVQDSLRLAAGLGPIYTRRIFGRDFVFVVGADLVADLSDESRFAKHLGPGVEMLRTVIGDGLFTAYNEEPNWRIANDILRPAFTHSAMRGYHEPMVAATRKLIAAWDARMGSVPVGRVLVDVSADMTKLTFETIGSACFGYEFGEFDCAQPHPFVTAMVGTLTYAQQRRVQVPVVGRLFGRRATAQYLADAKHMTDVVDDVIRHRRDSGDTSTRDLMGLMLNATHPDTGQCLDEVNIRNQVITFLLAGHETTAGALSFALYYLVRDPEVLAKARAEVDAVLGDRDDPTFEQVGKLRYVRRVLDETLRLWPTSPGYSIEARQDTLLSGRYPMSRGDWVSVIAPLLHRDPAAWGDDADTFDPDRFSPAQIKARPPHSYKPFGTGARACIARQFAIHEGVLALGMLLQHYEFTPDSAYRLKVKELLTLKPDGFTLTVSHRSPTPKPSSIVDEYLPVL